MSGRNKAGHVADLGGVRFIYLGLTESQSYQIFVRKVIDDEATNAIADGRSFTYKSETHTLRIVSRTLNHQKTSSVHSGVIKSALQELRKEAEALLQGNADNLQRLRFIPAAEIVESDDNEEDELNRAKFHSPGSPSITIDQHHQNSSSPFPKYQVGRQSFLDRKPLSSAAGSAGLEGGTNNASIFQHNKFAGGATAAGGAYSSSFGKRSLDPNKVAVPKLRIDKDQQRLQFDIRNHAVDFDSYEQDVREYTEITHELPTTSILYQLRSELSKAIRGYQINSVESYLDALRAEIYPGQNSEKFATWLRFTSFIIRPAHLTEDLATYRILQNKVEAIPAEELHGLNLLRAVVSEIEPHQFTGILTRLAGKFDIKLVKQAVQDIIGDRLSDVAGRSGNKGGVDTLYYTDNRQRFSPSQRGGGRGWHYNQDGSWGWDRDSRGRNQYNGRPSPSSNYRGHSANRDQKHTFRGRDPNHGIRSSSRDKPATTSDRRDGGRDPRSTSRGRSSSFNGRDNSRHSSRHTSTERVQM
eukprot:CAMPEP_0178988646 /NCGR_PEP_ID=MMETSP0795-20121207/3919_1 /TAXON_ID=88552 /ORGANISM="Amoebophrya sp., Strain Ameob2" /LENGTH=526 /DNA_ID=CAMNT_0020679929 /DNA_START=216 /DNA_END=1797 /DNA_ORIENTATION=-